MDLLDAIDHWLRATPISSEWRVHRFNPYSLGAMIQSPTLGTLDGYGWIFYVGQSEVESFFNEIPGWDGEGTETKPFKASDPEFFDKLTKVLKVIESNRAGVYRHG